MGNTESSMGLIMGSALAGLVLAPFTGGTSLMLVAGTSGAGVVAGSAAFTTNALLNRSAPEGEKMNHFLIGAGCGALGPACGASAKLGAEVTFGADIAGIGFGLGATTAGDDDKIKPYGGNQQLAVEHYRQKVEKERHDVHQKSEPKPIVLSSHQFIGDYVQLHTKYSKISDKYTVNYLLKNDTYKVNLCRFNGSIGSKTILASCALVNFDRVILKIYQLQDLQRSELNQAFHHFTRASVYGINAISIAKDFSSEESSQMYGMYAQQMDESFKNYCILMKSAMRSLVDGVKKIYSSGRAQALIERSVDRLYDEVAKSKAKTKPMCKKYGIYMDSEKYKLNLEQKIPKIEEYLNKENRINTFEDHYAIDQMVQQLNELIR